MTAFRDPDPLNQEREVEDGDQLGPYRWIAWWTVLGAGVALFALGTAPWLTIAKIVLAGPILAVLVAGFIRGIGQRWPWDL